MADSWLPEEWSLPRLLLVALVGMVAVTGFVAAGTSQTAFSTYNNAWDGASDLQTVANEQGAESVVALNTTRYTTVSPNATVSMVLSPDQPYSAQDRRRLSQFLARGGTLVVAEDFGSQTTPLLEALGVQTRINGVPLRDEQEYYQSPAFPIATNVTEHPETTDVEQLTLNHGTSLQTTPESNDTTVLVSSSEFSYLDDDRDGELDDSEELASRPVMTREEVGNGTVYVVSDPSIFINVMLERPGNAQLVQNLFGAHETVLLDYSHISGQPPLMVALLTLQESAFWQVVLSILGIGAIVWSSRLREQITSLSTRFRTPEKPTELSLADSDPDEIVEYLARQHPDWDEERLQRVMGGVIRTDEGTQSDE